ncbi:uncharacterized protein N7443_008718 [Penicillium atrosanguineum]|uniref:uncharacterized protein n=1 Tax=Penicillium atrosanguineum TaxID=1132637 RepID=UPI002384E581|nr:uncharacterized protein N7443_008718 [Penicillium atrosanguineum]KAJ5292765.1 hypothetical protein N7443_008718 [Penicillium atrosanguineum]
MVNPVQHQARRKLSAAPYSTQSISLLNGLIRRRAEALVNRLITGAAMSPLHTVDAFEICGLYSLEVICQAAFAIDLDSKPAFLDSSALLKAMDGSAKMLIIDSTLPFLRKTGLEQKVPGVIGDCYRKHAYWQSVSRLMTNHLLKTTMTSQDCDKYLVTPLLTGVDSFLGRKLTYEEILEEAMGIMFAGSGTTSTTLTYLFYALSLPSNQVVQKTLREQVRSLPENDIAVLRKMPYLNAVIKETFRLYPTIISTLPRTIIKPIEVGGFVLPVGTVVGMQNYVHQRDPRVFSEPERFDPERWLSSSPEMEQCLTPFSVGKRNCIGQNLAWDEIYLAVEAMMRSGVTLELGDEMGDWEMNMEDRFNIAPKGRRLMLKVTKP